MTEARTRRAVDPGGAHDGAPRSVAPAVVGGVRFGISGSPESSRGPGSAHAIERCRELGLDALEMAWVRSVAITPKGAVAVREASERHDVRLTVHAPYFVNLNSPDAAVVAASKERIAAAARGAAWCGARDVALHLAFCHDDPPETVFERVAAALAEVQSGLRSEGVDATLRPETMGRASQFGDLDEILALCLAVPGLAPCIDIAHLHARTGGWNTRAEFGRLWDRVEAALGAPALGDVHLHLSGIAYGDKGEKRHLALQESDLAYETFLEVMAQRGVRGVVVAESPAREADAVLLAETWQALHGRPADRADGR